MQQTIIITGMLLGGLGMFLLAVTMITDGLKATAGPALREMLSNWTRSPLHGIFSGVAITAIVQSSSAVTVATIGFVNAGIINMRQALGIVYGSNIGTTMTGWLVAIIGFKINVDAFALPMIGLGMILKLTGGENKRASIGLALVGFGLFFIGIDVLKDAFGGLVETIDLAKFTVDGYGRRPDVPWNRFSDDPADPVIERGYRHHTDCRDRGRSRYQCGGGDGDRRQRGHHVDRGACGDRRHAQREASRDRPYHLQRGHRGGGAC